MRRQSKREADWSHQQLESASLKTRASQERRKISGIEKSKELMRQEQARQRQQLELKALPFALASKVEKQMKQQNSRRRSWVQSRLTEEREAPASSDSEGCTVSSPCSSQSSSRQRRTESCSASQFASAEIPIIVPRDQFAPLFVAQLASKDCLLN